MRIAFDVDGVLVDFEAGYRAVETRLFGREDAGSRVPEPEAAGPDGAEDAAAAEAPPPAEVSSRLHRHRQDAIWREIRSTENFWAGLAPIDPGAVGRIHAAAVARRWDVLFVTQRPATAGDTVQRQTQQWLARHGFDLPSVLIVPGSRVRALDALHVDCLVDDSPKNCIDALSDSKAQPILFLGEGHRAAERSAKKLRIEVVRTIDECLTLLGRMDDTLGTETMVGKIGRIIGLK